MFVKEQASVRGKSIMDVAKECGLYDLCKCMNK